MRAIAAAVLGCCAALCAAKVRAPVRRSSAVASATPPTRSVLVVMEETETGEIEVLMAKHSRHEPEVDLASCHPETPVRTRRAAISDMGLHRHTAVFRTAGNLLCKVELHTDDKSMRSEWREPTAPWYLPAFVAGGEEEMKGVFLKQRPMYTLRVPLDVDGVAIEDLDERHVHSFSVARARGATVLETDEIVNGNKQTTGATNATVNLVFLSSGYLLSGGQQQFEEDVDQIVDFLQQDKEYPLSRYFPLVNVFWVFQPSAQPGASKPASGISVSNNLGCSYGSGSTSEPARALSCKRSLSVALADTSPARAEDANTVLIVLVNDEDYGGTGLYTTSVRLATQYAGALRSPGDLDTARSLFFHELGHAMVDLSDEYTVNVQEEGRNCGPPFADKYNRFLPLCEKNCAGQWSPGNFGWQKWIDQGTLGQPQPGCYFQNFYKPGNNPSDTPCLMEKVSGTGLCPVCKEASTLQLYNTGLNLTHPSCPHPEWATVYLALDDAADKAFATSVTIFISDKLYGSVSNQGGRNAFLVKWFLDGQELGGQSGSFFTLDAKARGLGVGRHLVRVDIEDLTTGVHVDNRVPAMKSSAEWRIEVVATFAELSAAVEVDGEVKVQPCPSNGPFVRGSAQRYQYFAVCTGDNGACSFEYKTSLYENPTDEDEAVEAVEGWIFGLGGALVGGGICLFMLIYFCLVVWSDSPRRVMEDCFSKPIMYIRRILIISNVFYIVASIGLAVMLSIMYTEVGGIAKIGLIAAMAAALLLFLMGIIGLTGAYSKKMAPLMFYGLVVMVMTLALLIMTALLYYFGYGSNDEGHAAQKYMEDEWKSRVQSDPSMICTMQRKFECSGWNVPCGRVFAPTQCPVECEETNAEFLRPCKVEVIKFVHKWLPISASFSLVLVYLLLCTALLVFMMFHILRKSAQLDEQKQALLQDGPIEGLLAVSRLHHGDKKQFRENLKNEFKRFDTDKDGVLDKLEFAEFFRQTIGVELSEEQLDLLFALIDIRGLGVIRIQDWMEVLVKTTELNVDEAIDFLCERKEQAAQLEDSRRLARLEEVDDNDNVPLALDEDNDLSFDQAYTCYGRLDDEMFEATKAEFLEIAEKIDGELRVTTERYREHLKKLFKLNMNSKKSQVVVEKLPGMIDKERVGSLTWTDWMATYFVRRDCYMEIVRKQRESVGYAQQMRRMTMGVSERDRVANLRSRASFMGMSMRRPGRQSEQYNEPGSSRPGQQIVTTDSDFHSVSREGGA